eukprot:EC821066.1.p1 GENE.EC821066.1~~EC821066.1.p1  ORF type:complete len:130 (+),score=32.12 EC821066.1:65-454(+)
MNKYGEDLIKVKVYLENNEIRRFKSSISFVDFLKILNLDVEMLENGTELLYLDKDLDWVRFNSQKEWEEAFNQYQKINSDFLRIKVINNKSKIITQTKKLNFRKKTEKIWSWNFSSETENSIYSDILSN